MNARRNDDPVGVSRRAAASGLVALGAGFRAEAQGRPLQIQRIETRSTEPFRGLVLCDDGIWASGAKNTVVKVAPTGKATLAFAGAGALDFRGLAAFDLQTAVAMSSGPGGASSVWLTQDGGRTWRRTAANADPNGFWDAVSFRDRERGLILGDPVGGRFTLLQTQDGGLSWGVVDPKSAPMARPGESAFAASNGCLAHGPRRRVAFCSGGGGPWARVFLSVNDGRRFEAMDTPIAATSPSSGAFAVAFDATGGLWVCGGDYANPDADQVNLAHRARASREFVTVPAPRGYLSSIAVHETSVIATGLAGTILSRGGEAFERIASAPFNTVRVRGDGMAALAGPHGAMASLRII